MQLNESPSVAVSVVVHAPAARLWSFVRDINLPASFSDEFQGAQWLSTASPGVGATFRGVNRIGASEWDTTCTVTAWVEDVLFTYVVEDVAAPAAIWSFALSPEGANTRLTFTATIGPGDSGVASAVAAQPDHEATIIARRLAVWQANMLATIQGMQRLAEG